VWVHALLYTSSIIQGSVVGLYRASFDEPRRLIDSSSCVSTHRRRCTAALMTTQLVLTRRLGLFIADGKSCRESRIYCSAATGAAGISDWACPVLLFRFASPKLNFLFLDGSHSPFLHCSAFEQDVSTRGKRQIPLR